MPHVLAGGQHLRHLFAALTEQTFQIQYGVADPPLIDYLSELLVRFVRLDAVFRVRDLVGRRLEEVAEMLREAQDREGLPQRELYRHIGDFTLFWTGVYPEALKQLKHWTRADALLDYREHGKHSYLLASQIPDVEHAEENRVLKRLSDEFEVCSQGLREVRREWEQSRIP